MDFRPNNLQILITSRCNLNCAFCHFNCTETGTDIDFKLLKSIIKQAAEMGFKSIALNGGEPLLYPRLIETLEYIKKLKMGISIITSGWHYEQFKQDLQKFNISWWFGLDGTNAETHDFLRGKKGSYERVTNAIVDSVKRGNFTGVQYVVTEQNYKMVSDLLEFIIKNPINSLLIHRLIPDGRARLTSDLDINDKQDSEVSRIVKINENKIATKISSGYLSDTASASCNHLTLSNVNVDWNGDVNLCSISNQYGLIVPNINKCSLKNAIDIISRINARLISQREKNLTKLPKQSCRFCFETFVKNKESGIYGIRCGKKLDSIDTRNCSRCLYHKRGICLYGDFSG